MVRDAMAGERRVKELGQLYLPPLSDEAGSSYESYKSRATFVNMTARTVKSLIGTIYRKPPRIIGLSKKLLKKLKHVSPDGASINMFSRFVADELAQVGRVGMLVDMDRKGINAPYMTAYIAENILAWKTEFIDGKEVLTYVLLREVVEQMLFLGVAGSTAPTDSAVVQDIKSRTGRRKATSPAQKNATQDTAFQQGDRPVLRAQYRVLALEDNKYVQKVYSVVNIRNVDTISSLPDQIIMPTKNGQPLDFIPFAILGTRGVSAKVTKSPMIDICNLNFAHYRASAQLEHGRFYTALPVYYAPVAPGQSGGAYTVGPSVVWEVPAGAEKPGIIEYHGYGLMELSKSLKEKEDNIAALGGRMMHGSDKVSQSPEVAALVNAAEMSVLTLVVDAASDGMTKVLRWWVDWQNDTGVKDVDEVEFILNRDFAASNVGAREMRSIALLYQAGVLPIQEVHRVFQDAELIAQDVSVDEFTAMLKDAAQFPNQADFEARLEGFANAQDRTQYEIAEGLNKSTQKVSGNAGDVSIEIQQMKQDAAKELADMQAKHQQELADLNAKHQKAMTAMGHKHDQKMASMGHGPADIAKAQGAAVPGQSKTAAKGAPAKPASK